jgi:hypothetical protein
MIQPRYTVEQRYDKQHKLTRYHVIQQAGASIADFASLTEAAVTARYLNQDTITYQERKIALAAMKMADGYNATVYPDPATIDTTIPEP